MSANYQGGVLPQPTFAPGVTIAMNLGDISEGESPARNSVGTLAENRPIVPLRRELPAQRLRSYYDDYYNRTWVLPAIIDLGAIANDIVIPLTIWNAREETGISLLSMTLSGLVSGVEYQGDSFPRGVKALEIVSYTLTVSAEGDATINGFLNVGTTVSSEAIAVPISGNRAFLWDVSFWPNWATPVRVSYEYLTEIITSRKGYEQRIAHRQNPRKTIEFEVTAIDSTSPKHREFRNLIRRVQNRPWVVPEWPRRAYLTQDAGDMDFRVHVESVPPWLYGGRQVIVTDGVMAKLMTVMNASQGVVNFSYPLGVAWKAGARVTPVLTCYLPDSLGGKVFAPFASGHSITAKQFPGDEDAAAFDPGMAGALLDGREVFTFKPDFKSEFSIESLWPVDTTDFGTGLIDRTTVIDFPAQTFKMSSWSRTFAEVDSVRQFFTRMCGRQKEFWMPSFEVDALPRTPATHGESRLRICDLEAYALFQNGSFGGAVRIVLDNDSVLYLKVANVSRVSDYLGSDSMLSFTDFLPQDIGPDNIVVINFMSLARFGTDVLAVEWETMDIGRYDLAVQTVRYVEAE